MGVDCVVSVFQQPNKCASETERQMWRVNEQKERMEGGWGGLNLHEWRVK